MSDMHDDFVLELAGKFGKGKKGPRRVATAAGAAFYGQPIGTIITADMIEAKRKENAANGVKPAKGMLAGGGGNKSKGTPAGANPSAGAASSSGSSGSAGGGQGGGGGNAPAANGGNIHTQTSYPAPGIDSTPPKWMEGEKPGPPQMAKGLQESSIAGTKKFQVGDSMYSAPAGSRLVRPKSGADMAIVITPDKELHFFTSAGEVVAEDLIKKVLTARFGEKVDAADTKYSEEDFDADSTLEDLTPGMTLNDTEGNQIFQKTEEGWVHKDLGVPVDEEDIKPLFESGDLVPGSAGSGGKDGDGKDTATDDDPYGDDDDVEIDFNSMSQDEFKEFAYSLENNESVYFVSSFGAGDTAVNEFIELKWTGESFASDSGEMSPIPVNSMYFVRKNLRTIEPSDMNPQGTAEQEEKSKQAEELKKTADAAAQKAALATATPEEAKALKAKALQDEAAAAQKAYEDAAGVTAQKEAEEAAQKQAEVDAAAAEKAKKSAAQKASFESAADEAADFSTALDTWQSTMSESEFKDVENLYPGDVVSAEQTEEIVNLPPGSVLYSFQSGYRYEKNSSGQWEWDYFLDPTTPDPGSGFTIPNQKYYVGENPFNGKGPDESWEPANLNSNNEVGQPPTSALVDSATTGYKLAYKNADGANVYVVSNSENDWVSINTADEISIDQLTELAGTEKLYIMSTPDQTKSLSGLVDGDEVGDNGFISKAEFFEKAPVGTVVLFVPNASSKTPLHSAILDKSGLWKTTNSNAPDSFDLPYDTDGTYFISLVPKDKEKQNLVPGDKPTEEWFETSPNGSIVSRAIKGSTTERGYFVKNDGGWIGINPKYVNSIEEGLADNESYTSPAVFAAIMKSDSEGDFKIESRIPFPKKQEPLALNKKATAGEPANFEQVLASPSGTMFKYNKLDGTQSLYSKIDDDTILGPNAVTIKMKHWKKSIDSGKVEFNDDTDLAVGPDGNYVFGESQAPILTLPEPLVEPTGNDEQDKKANDDYVEELADWEKELLNSTKDDIEAGVSYEDALKETGNYVTFGYDTTVTKMEVYEAIEALENHPHGSPIYGVKSLDDSNAIKTDIKDLIEIGKVVHPELPPKAAVIKLLKDKVEVAPLVDEVEDIDIQLGSLKPAKNAFGFTGGTFKKSEVKDAVSIIEGYGGKQYKSKLTQAGNPLGKLDFNTLVGKNKDKLEQKQQVLDALKKKLADNPDPTPAPTVDVAETTPTYTPVDLNAPKWYMVPKGTDIASLPFGTELKYMDADVEYIVQKNFDDEAGVFSAAWKEADGNTLDSYELDDYFSEIGISDDVDANGNYVNIQVNYSKSDDIAPAGSTPAYDTEADYSVPVAETPAAPETPSLKKLTPSDLANVPIGGTVVWNSTTYGDTVMTHTSDDVWEYDLQGYTKNASMGAMQTQADNGKISAYTTPPDSAPQKTPITDTEAFKNLPEGSVIQEGEADVTYTKVGGVWESGFTSSTYGDSSFEGAIEYDNLYLISKPSVQNQYTATPAEQSKSNAAESDEPILVTSVSSLEDLPAGTEITVGDFSYAKQESGKWKANTESAPEVNPSAFSYAVSTGQAFITKKSDSTPTAEKSSGAAPGIYSTANGNVIHVFADGSGATVVDGKLEDVPQDEMDTWFDTDVVWNYQGFPGDGKTTATAVPQKNKPAAKSSKPAVKITAKDIPDGIYFLGNSSNPDTKIWISDGKGSVMQNNADGSSTPVSDTKIKNAAIKGQLLNKFGNTKFLPENHFGAVYFLNQETNMGSLASLKYDLDDGNITLNGTSADEKFMALYGVYAPTSQFNNFANITQPDGPNKHSDALISFLDGIVPPKTNVPESELIEFDGDGTAFMPPKAALAMKGMSSFYGWGNANLKTVIADISSAFGDGKTIGRHVTAMNKEARIKWVAAFHKGNFEAMYNIEVEAAIKQGKAHEAGWKHPGYAGSPNTHNVNWGVSVPGEMPAFKTPDGEWPTNFSLSSLDLVDNYLLGAGMKNPQYLAPSEKRQWATFHVQGAQMQVNNLSSIAQSRKYAGEATKSPAPSLTAVVQPPKVYASLFDSTPYPTAWTMNTAPVFVTDFQSGKVNVTKPDGSLATNAEMQGFLDQVKPQFGETNVGKAYAMNAMFQSFQEQQTALDNVPVYTMAPTQTVKKSLHPIYNVVDQFGNKYIFKPANNDVNGAQYRAEVEAAANTMATLFGSRAPKTTVETFNGQVGSMQQELPAVASLSGFNWSSATPAQAADLANEHLVDWMLDQDDNWAPNTLILADGHLAGVDKGRAFANYGSWDGMRSDIGMDVNTHLVYSDLYQGIIKKQVSKDVADAAWLAANARANKIAKTDEGRILEILHEATDSRTNWNIDYKIDGKQVPQTQQGFFDAFFDRRSKLVDQTRGLWEDIYKKAGYGDLPEPPKAVLGEGQHSGLDDASFHSTVMTVGAAGTSTLVADPSADIVGGTVSLAAQKDSNGTKLLNGYLFLSPEKENEALSWFKSNSDPSGLSAPKADPTDFSSVLNSTGLNGKFTAAAKTIGAHAEDGAYNQSTLQNYELAKDGIAKDLEFWSPDLEPNSEGSVNFPSGVSVPFQQVDQYKMMLDYYQSKQSILDTALAEKAKPASMIESYSPITLQTGSSVHIDDAGQKLTKTSAGTWIHSTGGTVSVLDDTTAQSLLEVGEWKTWNDEKSSAKVVYKAVYNQTHHEKEGVLADNEVTVGGSPMGGVSGGEYSVTLPTGEKIFFRNYSTTSTLRSQRGRVDFQIPNAKTEQDSKDGTERVQQWLSDNLGLSLGAAEKDDAELLYWREMAGVLINRQHSSGSPWAKAQSDLNVKASEVNSSLDTVVGKLGKTLSVQEQNSFYRELWGKHFGKDKVDSLIATEKFLPYYENIDLSNPGAITGTPFWQRFDVDLQEFKSKDKIIASSAYSNQHTLDVTKSGGAFSTEHRKLILGKFITGTSSGSDQSYGSGNSVFTRIFGGTQTSGYSFVYHPKSLLRTRTYSFGSDHFGRLDDRKANAPSDPKKAWLNFDGGTNETMIPATASLLGDLEMIVFDNANYLNEAIQHMKKLGFETLRGLPIEDRLVMRANLAAAIAKVKKTWYE